jgi:hypothetical protein
MANDPKKIFNAAVEIIKKNKLYFIEEIVSFLPISKTSFYEYYKQGTDEMNTIKELLEVNRVDRKAKMREKWYRSENATLQVALMKLLSNEEEAHKLNGTRQEILSKTTHQFEDKTTEQLKDELNRIQGVTDKARTSKASGSK